MMTVGTKERDNFIRIHLDLLFFVGQKTKLLPKKTTLQAFIDLNSDLKFNCREALSNDENLLDEYLALNKDRLTAEELDILNDFRRKIKENFIFYKVTSTHGIFFSVDTQRFYAVKALTEPFHVFFAQYPALVATTLIPYKGQIVYDGFLQTSEEYSFAPAIISALNRVYTYAKRNDEIVAML
jgi:hypothetical protein